MFTESYQPLLSQRDDVLALAVTIAVLFFLTVLAYFYSAYFSYTKYRPKYLYFICCLVQEDERELKRTNEASVAFTDQAEEMLDLEAGALEETVLNPMLEIEGLGIGSALNPYTASALNESTEERKTFII